MSDEPEHEEPEHDGGAGAPGDETAAGLDNLIAYLQETRAFDLTGYKRTGLQRRLLKRLHALTLTSFDEYVDYLQVRPGEVDNLFNSILINATGFFRDPPAWQFLAEQVIPQMIEAKKNAAIRVWSAGCATGQEAYSVAMLLAEALGIDEFSRKVKIYATDMDEDALTYARQATYTPKEVSGVPPELLEKYFERIGTKHAFIKEARRSVIFGRHNLLHDAPISRVDLLSCRNALMYFNATAQARILTSVHFALADSGVLFLGKAEMLLTHSTLFAPLDLKRRLFMKMTHGFTRKRLVPLQPLRRAETPAEVMGEEAQLRDALLDASPVAQVGLNAAGSIAVINEHARKLFGLDADDIGRPFQDSAVARKIENLRTLVEQVHLDRRAGRMSACEVRRGDDSLFLDITVAPLFDEQGAARGVQMSFVDVSQSRRLQQELQQATEALEGAYEELQSTSEELETTNEELQSTVEELETTNEELQSTNEELQGMNDVLRARTGDLSRLNLHFESILASLQSAVVVLDLELLVQVWSTRASDLWGLRADEVQGKHFFTLDIGLPVEALHSQIRACVAGEGQHAEVAVRATNRRGKPIECLVKFSRLTRDVGESGIILLMDEVTGTPRTTEN